MAFVVVDVMADPQGYDEVMALGYRRVPLTVVGGRAAVGFDAAALDALTRDLRREE